MFLIPLVNYVLINGTNDLETAVDLSDAITIPALADPMGVLSHAEKVSVHILCDTKTGAVDVDIDTLEASHDGTNYSTAVDFGTEHDNIQAAATRAPTPLNIEEMANLVGASHLKLLVTEATAFSGSVSMKFLVYLAVTTPRYR